MKNTVVFQRRTTIFSTSFVVIFFSVILIQSINCQNANSEDETEISEDREKKAGGRPFMDPDEKRGGGRAFQFADLSSLKRGGARGFINSMDSEFDKRGGARGFINSMDSEFDKRGGGRGFLNSMDTDFDKRGGGRGFLNSMDSEFDKRGGARGFINSMDTDFDKRGGGHGFIIPLADKRDHRQDVERRAGARAFSMPLSELAKRGGARPFYAIPEWKRGGGRAFSNFYQGGTMKRGGGRAFQTEIDKRGGGRGFQMGMEKRGGGHGFKVNYDIMDKRGGGRSFLGGGSMRSFYGGSGSGFPFSYEKKAVEYVPYYMNDQLKRGGARGFNAPLNQRWYTEKRAGGRTFPIEDMDDSKEKRMIDEMARFYS